LDVTKEMKITLSIPNTISMMVSVMSDNQASGVENISSMKESKLSANIMFQN
jgi:hypothetical protein